MHALCVFLGSQPGRHAAYREATVALGRELARRGITCVYGGSRTGLMLDLAASVLQAGGQVIGVTVQALKDREQHHTGLSQLHVVPTMAERKRLMLELADACVALPGGVGTLEELLEVYTLRSLGFHSKPCGVVNVRGYYDPLLRMLREVDAEGFMKPAAQGLLTVAATPAALLETWLP